MPADDLSHDATLVELVRRRAAQYGEKTAFRFSYNGDGADESRLSYQDLDLRARAIAAGLQERGAVGERVLVVCGPGLDSIAGLIGCFYAGAVAVPVHQRLAPSLRLVVPDAQTRFALATSEAAVKIEERDHLRVDGQPLQWCSTDEVTADARDWTAPDVDPESIAAIQYTSGSTRSPKGAVLTHRNVLATLESADQIGPDGDQGTNVFWVPHHHNMGLHAGILLTLYTGTTTALMSPAAFRQRPMRWLEAVSRYRAVLTVATDFAYRLCVEQSTEAERAALDLTNLECVVTGGDPVQASTLKAFADAFAPAGFRPEAFVTAYGLTEVTMVVAGSSYTARPMVVHLDRGALGENRAVDAASADADAVTLVGSGRLLGGNQAVIVDPETRRSRGPDEVGEIWIAGPNVAQGYWRRPEETEQTFGGYLSRDGGGHDPFLRTGDLGFLRAGELFVTGRVTDLVVIDGHNYYPDDLERTVQACDPVLKSGRGAAFTIPPTQQRADEQLIVVQEVGTGQAGEAELGNAVGAVRAAVTKHYGIAVSTVLLVEHLSLPTTATGKTQRGLCRQQFLDGALKVLAGWQAPPPAVDNTQTPEQLELAQRLTAVLRNASAPGNPPA